MIDKDTLELYELIVALHEGDITEEQFARLNEKLKQKDSARRYVEFVSIFSDLSCPSEVDVYFDRDKNNGGLKNDHQDAYTALMKKFAEEEMTAPKIQIPRQEPKPELIQKVKRQKLVYRFNKSSLIGAITPIAAILLILLFVKYAPVRAGKEVATLIDTLNAKWADVSDSMDKGTRLYTRSNELFLREGLAELLFNNHTKVVIEGPAEFELLAEDRIDLRYGRLFATVPHEAIGFIVSTPTSRIIDLGTEFGVQADAFGDVRLHVIKGKTTLIAGGRSNRVNMEVAKGQAKKVSGPTQSVSDIPCDTKLFVRDINSDAGFIWKGQMEINLADVVGGGNGLDTGIINSGLDVMTGQRCAELRTIELMSTTGQYKPVIASDLIDGVFTVNNRDGRVFVDPAGHFFDPGYLTEGKYWGYIMNGAFHHGPNVPRHQLVLDGQLCGTKDNPAIGIHPNMGITFDLNEIRKQLPEIVIDKFTAKADISETVAKYAINHHGNVDFWVLLDGEVKFNKRMQWQDASCAIELPIRPESRFLTLITTDGGDNDKCAYDWAMFVNPVLELRQDD